MIDGPIERTELQQTHTIFCVVTVQNNGKQSEILCLADERVVDVLLFGLSIDGGKANR